MNKTPCQYAIVRFMPYVETGEFANVGVVMMAPQARYFGFKLLTRRHRRITEFFKELEANVFRHAMSELREELERVHDVLKSHGFERRLKNSDTEFSKELFAELLRTRESIVRFGEPRVVMAGNPKETLKELFAYYAERNFVTKEYRETVLNRGVRELLLSNRLDKRFQHEKLGDDKFHVTFPFVELHDEQPTKVIKPLNLAQNDATKIREHGNIWEFRIRQLQERRAIPDRILFAYEGPQEQELEGEACQEAVDKLRKTGATVLPYEEQEEILEFARA